MGEVTFSVFADLHFREGDWNWATARLEAILARAARHKADFVIHCGDFCHDIVAAREVIDRYNRFPIPAYHTLGNHDFEVNATLAEVLDAYRMDPRGYYFFDVNGFRMIVLDSNYFRAPEGTVHHYAETGLELKCHQKALLIPPAEMAFLRNALESAPGPCLLFSHGSLFSATGIANRGEITELLAQYPVPLWINGHYHRNALRIAGRTAFFDLNSTTSVWVETPHHAYPPDLMAKCHCSEHELLYAEPVHAVVTVKDDGEIVIRGMKGSMYDGVTCEMTGNPSYNDTGLPCDPSVLSTRFRLSPRD